MESELHTENIKQQAQKWSLEGDSKLLEWMKRISENLERRCNNTKKNLDELNRNVNRTQTALDNAANSLTALQYTQFVESRVQNDDETIANPSNNQVHSAKSNEMENKSSEEIMTTILQNNMQMLEDCYEKFTLDFDDSDDEDSFNNFIYQPKNPYNERLLPHIYGTKLWKENSHVGISDNLNEYSSDGVSDVYSESSTSLHDELNESVTNLSDWASVNDEHATHHQQQPQMIVPKPQEHTIITAGSDSIKSLANAVRIPERKDNDNVRMSVESTPPQTSTSSSISGSGTSSLSSSQYLDTKKSIEQTLNSNKVRVLPYIPDKPPDLDSIKENEQIMNSNDKPIKRKPVNLFDDDDFNSFITEITDKVQQRNIEETSKSMAHTTKENIKTVENIVEPQKTELTNETGKQKKRVNLFDSCSDEDLFSNKNGLFASVNQAPTVTKNVEKNPTKITAKSLFDDDDENDDDFLNIFQTNKFTLPKSSNRTLLFNDENTSDTKPDEIKPSVTLKKEETKAGSSLFTEKLFNEFNDSQTVIPSTKSETKREETNKRNVSPKVLFENDLFADEDDLFSSLPSVRKEKQVTDTSKKKPSMKTKSLFVDDTSEGDDDDDIFSKKGRKAVVPDGLEINKEKSKDEQPIIKSNSAIGTSIALQTTATEPTMSKQRETNEITHAEATVNSSSVTQKYSNIFLDEPPDDEDFFQTLGANHLSSTKTTLNADRHYDEVPVPIKAADKSISNEIKTNQTLQKGYNSLTLFSDIPPEDDDAVTQVENAEKIVIENKRVQNIFYDDVAETEKALKEEISTESHVNEIKSSSSVDETDRRSIENVATEQTSPTKKTKGISKLQMPKININVQALMPTTSSTLDNYKKVLNERRTKETGDQEQHPVDETYSEDVNKTLTTSQRSQNEDMPAEGILTSVCKTRVRAPINRRPSTRRARQENYFRGIVDEQNIEDMKEEQSEQVLTIHNAISENNEIESKLETAVTMNTQNFSNSFQDENEYNEDDDFLFAFKTTDVAAASIDEQHNTVQSNAESQLPKRLNFFDEPPDDDDMFSSNKHLDTNLKDSLYDDSLFGNADNDGNDDRRVVDVGELKNTSTIFDEPPEDTHFESRKSHSVESATIFDKPTDDTSLLKDTKNELITTMEGLYTTETAKISSNNNIFDDEPPENIEDIVFPSEVKTSNVIHTQSIYDELNDNDSHSITKEQNKDNDENISPAQQQPVQNEIKEQSQPESISTIATKKRLFFDDDDDDDDDDDMDSLFGNNKSMSQNNDYSSSITSVDHKPRDECSQGETSQQLNLKLAESEQIVKAQPDGKVKSLFSDSDDGDDDDDLFDSSETLRKATVKTNNSSVKSQEPNVVQSQSSVTKSENKPLNPQQKSLFDSDNDDGDNDDLFKTTSKIQTTSTHISNLKKKPEQPKKKSLFDDSDEDEDNKKNNDIDYRNRANDDVPSALKVKNTKQSSLSVKSDKTNNYSLFSDIDDDDEDDLFGNIKGSLVNKKTSNPLPMPSKSQTSITATASSSSNSSRVDDNPLADLLDS